MRSTAVDVAAARKAYVVGYGDLKRASLLVGVVGFALALAACAQTRVTTVARPAEVGDSVRKPAAPGKKPSRPALAQPHGDYYIVRAGDTVFGIAFRAGLNFRELAAWNNIGEPYTIRVGQRLRLRSPVVVATPSAPATHAAASTPANFNPAKPTTRAVAISPPPIKPVAVAAPARTPALQPLYSSPTGSTTVATGTGKPVASGERIATRPLSMDGSTAGPVASSSTPLPAMTSASATSVAAYPTGSADALTSIVLDSSAVPQWRWPSQGPLIGRFMAGEQTQQGINIAGSAGQPVLAAADGVVVYSGAGLVGYGELIIVKHSNEWLSAYAHNRRRLVVEGAEVKVGQSIAEMGRTGAVRDMLHFEIRRNGKPVDPLHWLPAR